MDMFSFSLGVILGVGIPYAIVEVRDFLYRRSVRKNAPSAKPWKNAPSAKPWTDAPPSIACPLPSPHSPHDERVCAISWYLKHQH
jgi:hypothetical protein